MTVRGCGSRAAGGIYLRTRLMIGGRPLNEFLIDPPKEIPAGFELPARGIVIHQRPGTDDDPIYDVYDRIGTKNYPNIWDFYIETKKLGLSRRVSAKTDLSKLDARSRIYLSHERAIVTNVDKLYAALRDEAETYGTKPLRCPCGVKEHEDLPFLNDQTGILETCASCWANLITGGEDTYDPQRPPRTIEREIGEIRYFARKAPEGFTPKYQEGFWLRLPLNGIDVIRDGSNPKRQMDAEERAGRSGLDVTLEDE